MLSAARRLYIDAYTGLSRNTWYLTIVMLINRSGTMVIPFMTIYCTQKLHFTLTQAGFVMGLFGFGAIVGALIGGRVTDKFGVLQPADSVVVSWRSHVHCYRLHAHIPVAVHQCVCIKHLQRIVPTRKRPLPLLFTASQKTGRVLIRSIAWL